MRRWDLAEIVQEGQKQAIQRGESELLFSLDSRDARHSKVCDRRGVVQQRRLAHTGLAVKDQCAATTLACRLCQAVYGPSLINSIEEDRFWLHRPLTRESFRALRTKG